MIYAIFTEKIKVLSRRPAILFCVIWRCCCLCIVISYASYTALLSSTFNHIFSWNLRNLQFSTVRFKLECSFQEMKMNRVNHYKDYTDISTRLFFLQIIFFQKPFHYWVVYLADVFTVKKLPNLCNLVNINIQKFLNFCWWRYGFKGNDYICNRLQDDKNTY